MHASRVVANVSRRGGFARYVAETRKHFFQTVNFQELGGLTAKSADAEVATRGEQLAAEQDESCQRRGGRLETPAQVQNNCVSAAINGQIRQSRRLHVGEALAGSKGDGGACDHDCASYTLKVTLDCGSATVPVQTLRPHRFPCIGNIQSIVTSDDIITV